MNIHSFLDFGVSLGKALIEIDLHSSIYTQLYLFKEKTGIDLDLATIRSGQLVLTKNISIILNDEGAHWELWYYFDDEDDYLAIDLTWNELSNPEAPNIYFFSECESKQEKVLHRYVDNQHNSPEAIMGKFLKVWSFIQIKQESRLLVVS